MIIPKDAIIAEEKVRDYLLVPLDADDKSGYLALAGYTREEYWELLRDIRNQLLPAEAQFQYRNKFGDFFIVRGVLQGSNGKRLVVHSIWVLDVDNIVRFVTLRPGKRE
jgi:hypothetical protein